MKQRHSIKPITLHRRKQAGDALLDALIAMVLASVVGLGPVYVASRGAVAQTQAAYQNMAVVEMRKLLAAQGPALCGTTPTITVNKVDATAGTTTAVINQLPVTVTCTDRAAPELVGSTATPPMVIPVAARSVQPKRLACPSPPAKNLVAVAPSKSSKGGRDESLDAARSHPDLDHDRLVTGFVCRAVGDDAVQNAGEPNLSNPHQYLH